MAASSWVHLNVTLVKRATPLALLLVLEDPDQDDVWIPKSQMEEPDAYAEGDTDATISVTEYIAKQKGLS